MRFTNFLPPFIPLLASHVSSRRVPVTGRVPRADSDHPVSVLTAGDKSFGFSHAANDGYTATLWVNGVPFQASPNDHHRHMSYSLNIYPTVHS